MLKAKTTRVSPIPLGRSDSVSKLDEVLVLGFPAGPSILEAGIAETSPARGTVRKVEHTIQVTAAMIGGNSGGPLLDRLGRVIGISTRVIKGTETLGTTVGNVKTSVYRARKALALRLDRDGQFVGDAKGATSHEA